MEKDWFDKKFIRINYRAISEGFFKLKGSILKVLRVRLLLADDDGNCNFPSYWIAKNAGSSLKTVLSAEKELEKLGWFVFSRQTVNGKRRKAEGGRWAENNCKLNLERLPDFLRGVFRIEDRREFFLTELTNGEEKVITEQRVTVGKNSATEKLPTNSLLNKRNPINKDITKVLSKNFNYHGNQDINEVIDYFKQTLKLPALDGTVQENRRYAQLTLKKFNGVERVKRLIDLLVENNFWNTKITSFKDLYYRGVRILSETRQKGGVVYAE